MFTGTKLTTQGMELNTYLITNNLPLNLSKMKIGSGYTEEFDRTDLVNAIMETEIEKITNSGSVNVVRATFTNENLNTGFDVREVGIFALNKDGNEILYAYDNAGNGEVDYFEAGTGNVILKEVFEIAASFENVTSVTLTINPELVFLTEDEANTLIASYAASNNFRNITMSTEEVTELEEGHIHIVYEEAET